MQVWRAGTQFVVAREGGVFAIIDAAGAVVRQHAPSDSALEDDRYIRTFVVKRGELVEEVTIDRGVIGPPVYEETVVLAGLTADGDPDTHRFVEIALGDHAVTEEHRRQQAHAAGLARVAAIDGARERQPGGELVARAQAALCDRIQIQNDHLAPPLLRTLITLGRARVNPLVLEQYALGCLAACFENVPKLQIEADPAPSPALAGELAERAIELEETADYKDWVDATGTASAYRNAARHVRAAARLLGG